MLDTDHVELRRWLVDTGFVRRTDFGSDYRRGSLPSWLAEAAGALGSQQLAGAARQARAARDAQREAKRQAWLARQIEVTEGPAEVADPDETLMRLALDQARNAWALAEVPVGAVVVKDGQVIATGFDQPSATAIRRPRRDPGDARRGRYARQLPAQPLRALRAPWSRARCVREPAHARIKRLVFGARDRSRHVRRRRGPRGPKLNRHTQVRGGVLGADSGLSRSSSPSAAN